MFKDEKALLRINKFTFTFIVPFRNTANIHYEPFLVSLESEKVYIMAHSDAIVMHSSLGESDTREDATGFTGLNGNNFRE